MRKLVRDFLVKKGYDVQEAGIDYSAGTEHLIEGTHYVLGTDEEVAQWLSE